MTDAIRRLREILKETPVGPLRDSSAVRALLNEAWDDLAGSEFENTTAEKLRRMEDLEWEPPNLTFLIERHGGTVMGSTRGSLHRWTVNLDRTTAQCDQTSSYRQLASPDPPLRVKPLAADIAELVKARRDDARLKWLTQDRSEVRVLVGTFITAKFKQTLTGRRRRFANALDAALGHRWSRVVGKRDVFREASGDA